MPSAAASSAGLWRATSRRASPWPPWTWLWPHAAHHPTASSTTPIAVCNACGDYAAKLAAHRIQPSMSRVGNPYDNAKSESFMKTLKHEEVDGRDYRDISAARESIGRFIEEVYNRCRLHSALA